MKHGILVELDALLDTRVPTVASLDIHAGMKLVGDKAYYHRPMDDFSFVGIDREVYRRAYAARGVETLKYARVTGAVLTLASMVTELELQKATSSNIGELGLEINIFPYALDEEQQLAIAQAVGQYVGKITPIGVVSYSPQELTPSFCRQRYGAMVFYNFNDWIQYHVDELIARGIPQVTVLAPALYHDRVPTPEEAKVENLPAYTPFMMTELSLSEAMHLEMLPPEVFSLIRE